jgi:hypothetical protein
VCFPLGARLGGLGPDLAARCFASTYAPCASGSRSSVSTSPVRRLEVQNLSTVPTRSSRINKDLFEKMCTFTQKPIIPYYPGRCVKQQNNCPGPYVELLNPLWIGTVHLGEAVLEALQSFRIRRGLVISLAVAACTVRAILSERCPDLLAENRGPVKVSHGWVSSWLYVNIRWTCQQTFSVRKTDNISPCPWPRVAGGATRGVVGGGLLVGGPDLTSVNAHPCAQLPPTCIALASRPSSTGRPGGAAAARAPCLTSYHGQGGG